MSAKPLTASQPLSEFGDLHQSSDFNDPHFMDRDQSYVPGFSEMRRDRDMKVAEFHAGSISRADVPSLPVNLRWARNQNRQGNPDNSKPYNHSRKGYRLVTAKDEGQAWFTQIPPGAQIGADGSIRNGDCVLMVASAQDAARSEHAKRALTQERINGITSSFQQNAAAVGANPAAQPTVTMEPTTPTDSAKPGRR